MIKSLFEITYHSLKLLEDLSGFTYRELNILIWFYGIPLFWCFLIDKIRSSSYFKLLGFSIAISSFLFIPNFEQFSHQLFDFAVDFLNYFNTWGSNYILSSVIFCLFIPILITAFLLKKVYQKRTT